MKKYFLYWFLCLTWSAGFSQPQAVEFSSSDTALQAAFYRAKEMALRYKGQPGDPVGPWYESALPPRSAFCMRDVSHQSIAGEILGLTDANKNMMQLFAKNISAGKNWCSFWEMNKYGGPAPEDYRNDTAFWYNLNANFDVLNACWNLYRWTGDKAYLQNAAFKKFYALSVNEFISSWVLQPDSLLSRPAHPNAPVNFNSEDAFHRCRGLPSYSEGVPDIKMGIDLVAALYRGLLSYAAIERVNGNNASARLYESRAAAYQRHIDAYWWDDTARRYNTFYSNAGHFGKNEGETFLFWFDALKDSTRKQITLQHLLAGDWNVENLSYFPLIFCLNGYADKGYEYILHLTNPATARREYPEVSFGVIRGIVEGLMGLDADARYNRISTLYRHRSEGIATIKNLSLLGGLISVTHNGNESTQIMNQGGKAVNWRAGFRGSFPYVFYNGKRLKTRTAKDWQGQTTSYVDILVDAGKKAEITLLGRPQ